MFFQHDDVEMRLSQNFGTLQAMIQFSSENHWTCRALIFETFPNTCTANFSLAWSNMMGFLQVADMTSSRFQMI